MLTNLSQVFWTFVNKRGSVHPTYGQCWEWNRGRFTQGYGATRLKGKSISTHRFSWIMHYGKIPSGLLICHKCDNRLCVRPTHLFIGTHKSNSKDMVNKSRSAVGDRNGMKIYPEAVPRGERNGMAKLNGAKINSIRKKYKSGKFSQKDLAIEYGIAQQTVYKIVARRSWKHI